MNPANRERTLLKQLARETWGWAAADRLVQDLSFAIRTFSRTPGFAVVVVLTLSVAIGASLAAFSVVDAMFLRPLPFRDAANVLALWERPPRTVQWKRQTVPYSLFQDWQRNPGSLEEISGFTGRDFTLTVDGQPQLVRGDIVTSNFFTLLGTHAAYGRTILPTDASAGPIVVLSDGLWRQRFGSNPTIVGQSLVLNGLAYTVVGVLPGDPELPFLEQPPDLWTVVAHDDPELTQRAGRLAVIGRLRKGADVGVAESELVSAQRAFQAKLPLAQRADGVIVRPLQLDRAETLRPTLLVVVSAIAGFMLIACVNVAGLWLGRLLQRTREIAVRTSLGASRGRLIRQFATEVTLLWSLGGVLGVMLGAVAIKWLAVRKPFPPDEFPSYASMTINGRGIAFAVTVTLITAVIFGVLSALQGSRLNLGDALKSGGRGSSATRSTQRWRSLLVVAEVMVSVLLLAGATLLVTSLARLGSQPLGFQADRVLLFKLQLPQGDYPTDSRRIQFQRDLTARLRALPGVESVGTTSARPLSGIVAAAVEVEGSAQPMTGPPSWSGQQSIDADYFRAMGMAVLQGRPFEATDTETSEPVVIVNRTFARKYFPDQNPIGRRLKHGTSAQDMSWMRVVGVVNDVKHASLEWDVLPETFVPYTQVSGAYARVIAKDINVVVRGQADMSLLRAAVWSIDSQLPLFDVTSAVNLVNGSADRPRFRTGLVSTFALIALVLASIGLYGVLSQAVLQRHQEFGIRMALGATSYDVIRQVLRQGMTLAALGAAGGIAATLATGRIVASLLYGVAADDIRVLAGVVVAMLLVATLASLIPAMRAATIDPLGALRED